MTESRQLLGWLGACNETREPNSEHRWTPDGEQVCTTWLAKASP